MTKTVAVVTGGTRGIGSAISEALKQAGHDVVAIYNGNHEAAQAFSKKTGIHVQSFDVSDYEACEKGIKEIKEKFGSISILVNNAGITRDGFLHKMTPKAWQDVTMTNLTSCFNMSRSVIEDMRQNEFGRIVNISSVNGQKGQLGQTNYAAAKAGILGFTRALALEGAKKNITVNAIAPGYIETDMVKAMSQDVLNKIVSEIPTGRLGQPEEIARVVVFLCDPKNGFINGATFSINGGQYMAA